MKKLFTTRENWLLIVPLIIWLLEKAIVGYSTVDINVHDTYFVFTNTSFGTIFLFVIIIPFGCHMILRMNSNGSQRLLYWHVLLSCSLCILLVVIFHYRINFLKSNAIAPRQYYDSMAWENPASHYIFFQTVIALLVLIYVLLQIGLMIYTLIKLLR